MNIFSNLIPVKHNSPIQKWSHIDYILKGTTKDKVTSSNKLVAPKLYTAPIKKEDQKKYLKPAFEYIKNNAVRGKYTNMFKADWDGLLKKTNFEFWVKVLSENEPFQIFTHENKWIFIPGYNDSTDLYDAINTIFANTKLN